MISNHVHQTLGYALALLLANYGKAHVIDKHRDGDRIHLTVQTGAGERFATERPALSEELQAALTAVIRQK